jgi:two-component system LytT family sensor kinase
VQVAATEDDLRARATASVQDIFQAPARLWFDPRDACDAGGLACGNPVELIAPLGESPAPGSVRIQPRPDGMPFLSDDRRLLHSLARTLGVVLENVRFREREQELRWLASRAELKALRAQMNPHFLFNALNAIAGLIEEQPRLADETIEQLAHVLRYALRRSENEWVRLDEEIEFVAAYLRVEQARFGERLSVEFGVDRAAAGVPVPAMTIQPLVENAIKHGVSALEGMGTIGVRAVLKGELLCVEVSDNGPGFPRGFSIGEGGQGLRNIVERIAGYYGDCAQLRWESAWESGRDGTRVFLNLPRRSASNPVGKHGSDARLDRG